MNAEHILDRALALTALPERTMPLDHWCSDLDDDAPVVACKVLAVKMARYGDDEACLLALQHAAAHVGGYAEV